LIDETTDKCGGETLVGAAGRGVLVSAGSTFGGLVAAGKKP